MSNIDLTVWPKNISNASHWDRLLVVFQEVLPELGSPGTLVFSSFLWPPGHFPLSRFL